MMDKIKVQFLREYNLRHFTSGNEISCRLDTQTNLFETEKIQMKKK